MYFKCKTCKKLIEYGYSKFKNSSYYKNGKELTFHSVQCSCCFYSKKKQHKTNKG
jgi:hypothetical protein